MSINRAYFKDAVSWDGTADYDPSFEHMPELASLETARCSSALPAITRRRV